MPAEDGKRLIHCHLEINGGSLMLADTFPDQGHGLQPLHSYTLTVRSATSTPGRPAGPAVHLPEQERQRDRLLPDPA
jgi:uncharacterized glyoxalase superfamily protein PhnB